MDVGGQLSVAVASAKVTTVPHSSGELSTTISAGQMMLGSSVSEAEHWAFKSVEVNKAKLRDRMQARLAIPGKGLIFFIVIQILVKNRFIHFIIATGPGPSSFQPKFI
jgi:hypothetical protein